MKLKLEAFESVDSTNNYIKRRAREGAPEGTVAIADAQTGGKGRLGRSFASPPGVGIYLSLLLRPEGDAADIQSLTANTAVAVSKAIEKTCGINPEIKWVNDLLLNGRKICGILCESEADDKGLHYVVIGIGLNVTNRTEDFPAQLRNIAGSIYTQTGIIAERGMLISAILSELDSMYECWKDNSGSLLADYNKRWTMLGHLVEVASADEVYDAVAEDISEDFGLCLRLDDGSVRVIHSGEVSARYKS